jgi:hypothetical protein
VLVAFTLLWPLTARSQQDKTQGDWDELSANTDFRWDIITTDDIRGGKVDDIAIVQPLGFTFVFHGNNYNAITITSPGMIGFGDVTGTLDPDDLFWRHNQDLSAGTVTIPIVAAFWENAGFSRPDASLKIQTLGSPPYRRTVVEYANVTWLGDGNPDSLISVQVKFFETINTIEIHYLKALGDSPPSDGPVDGVTVGTTDGSVFVPLYNYFQNGYTDFGTGNIYANDSTVAVFRNNGLGPPDDLSLFPRSVAQNTLVSFNYHVENITVADGNYDELGRADSLIIASTTSQNILIPTSVRVDGSNLFLQPGSGFPNGAFVVRWEFVPGTGLILRFMNNMIKNEVEVDFYYLVQEPPGNNTISFTGELALKDEDENASVTLDPQFASVAYGDYGAIDFVFVNNDTLEAGKKDTLILTLRDENGYAKPKEPGENILINAAGVVGGDLSFNPYAATGDTSFYYEVTATKTGAYTITAEINDGSTLLTETFAPFVIEAAPIDLVLLTGPAAAGFDAGEVKALTATAYDEFNNLVEDSAGFRLAFTSTVPEHALIFSGGSPVDSIVALNSEGQAFINVTSTVAGDNRSIYVYDASRGSSVLLGTSAPPFSVLPGPFAQITFSTESVTIQPAVYRSRILTTYDAFGNPVITTDGQAVTYQLSDGLLLRNEETTISGSTASFEVTGTRTGSFSMTATVGGVTSVALPIEVIPGNDPSRIVAYEFDIAPDFATDPGFARTISVSAVDEFGNVVTTSNADEMVTVMHNGSAGDVILDATGDVIDVALTNGSGSFSLQGVHTGAYQLNAVRKLDGANSSDSEVFSITPGVISEFTTTFTGPFLAGQTETLDLQALDAFGNAVTDSAGLVIRLAEVSDFAIQIDGALAGNTSTLDGAGQATFSVTATTVPENSAPDIFFAVFIPTGQVGPDFGAYQGQPGPLAQIDFQPLLPYPTRYNDNNTWDFVLQDEYGNMNSSYGPNQFTVSADPQVFIEGFPGGPIDKGPSNGVVTYAPVFANEPGTYSLRFVAGAGVPALDTTITDLVFLSGPIASFVEQPEVDIPAGGSYELIVEARDANGKPATADAGRMITIAELSGTNWFAIEGQISDDAPLEKPLGADARVTFTILAGTTSSFGPAVRVVPSDEAGISRRYDFNIGGAAFARFATDIDFAPLTSSSTPLNGTVTVLDKYDNLTDSLRNELINYTSSDPAGLQIVSPTTAVAPGGTAVISVRPLLTGTYEVYVDYKTHRTTFTGIVVQAGDLDHLSFSLDRDGAFDAGQSRFLTISARDAQGNLRTDQGGNVTLSSNPAGIDIAGQIFGNTTEPFTSGQANFYISGETAGDYTFTAVTGIIADVISPPYTIEPAPIDTFIFNPASGADFTIADVGFGAIVTITAADAYGNALTDSAGMPVQFIQNSGPDLGFGGNAILPLLANGTVILPIGTDTAGTIEIEARTYNPPFPPEVSAAASYNFVAGEATTLAFSVPSDEEVDAGLLRQITVYALDDWNNIDLSFNEAVTSITPSGGDFTINSAPNFSNGELLIDITGRQSNSYNITVQTTSLSGDLLGYTITPAPLATFEIQPAPGILEVYPSEYSFQLTARDAFGNAVTDSTNLAVTLLEQAPSQLFFPTPVTKNLGADGQITFAARSASDVGEMTLTVLTEYDADDLPAAVVWDSFDYLVRAGPATNFAFDIPDGAHYDAGTAILTTVTAVDQNGLRDSSYVVGGNFEITLETGPFDPFFTVTPIDPAWDFGQRRYEVRLENADAVQSYTLGGDDEFIDGESEAFFIDPAVITDFVFSIPTGSDFISGQSDNVVISTFDIYGNAITDSAGLDIVLTYLAGPTGVVSPLNLQLDGFGEALFSVEGNAVGQSFYTVSTAATPKVSTIYIINTVADNASRLVIDYDGPTRLIAGDSYPLTVRATDASGNTDLSWTDPISLADNGSNADDFIIIPGVQSNGIRPFTIRPRKAYEFYNLTATSTGLTSAFLNNLEVTAGFIDSLDFAPIADLQVPNGQMITVTVRDSLGNAHRDTTSLLVEFEVISGPMPDLPSPTTFSPDGSGQIFIMLMYSEAVENARFRLRTGAFDVIDSSNVYNVLPGPAVGIEFIDSAPLIVDAGLSRSYFLRAADIQGNTVTDFAETINLSLQNGNPGDVIISQNPPVNGIIEIVFEGRLAKAFDPYSIRAQASPGGFTAFSPPFEISPAPIAELLIDNIPDISVDTPQLISARASDAFGNAIIDSVGLEIIIESISGPALIEPDPPSAVLDNLGFVVFPLRLNEIGTNARIRLRTPSYDVIDSSNVFASIPGPAVALAFNQPQVRALDAGQSITIEVTAEDAFGNTVTTFSENINLAQISGPGGGVQLQKLSQNAGIAAFELLARVVWPSGYELQASANGLPNRSYGGLMVTPGVVDTLVFITEVGDFRRGEMEAITIEARDSYGNVIVDSAGLKILIEDVKGPPRSAPPGFVLLNGSGQAVFDLEYANPGSPVQFRVRTPAYDALTLSNEFTVYAAAATQLVLDIPTDFSIPAGEEKIITVTAVDANLDRDSLFAEEISLSEQAGNPDLSIIPIDPAMVKGARRFRVMANKVEADVGYYTLLADAPMLGVSPAYLYTVLPLQLADFVYPGISEFVAAVETPYTVTAVDIYGNAIDTTALEITLRELTTDGFTISDNTALLDPGSATATFTIAGAKAGSGYQLQARAPNGIGPGMSGPLTVLPGAHSDFVFNFPAGNHADAGQERQLNLLAVDAANNPVDISGTLVSLMVQNGDLGLEIDGIPAGPASKTATGNTVAFTLQGRSTGDYMLGASGGPVSAISPDYTILPGVISSIDFAPIADFPAGQSQAITAVAKDTEGNAITDSLGLTILLQDESGGFIDIDDPLAYLNGSGQVSWDIGAEEAGLGYTLSAATLTGQAESFSGPFNVTGGEHTTFVLSYPNGNSQDAGTQRSVIVSAVDGLRNPVDITGTWVTVSSGGDNDFAFEIGGDDSVSVQFTGSSATLNFTPTKSGTFTLQAQRTNEQDRLGFSAAYAVRAGVVADFEVVSGAWQAGVDNTLLFTIKDTYGNVVRDSAGLQFTIRENNARNPGIRGGVVNDTITTLSSNGTFSFIITPFSTAAHEFVLFTPAPAFSFTYSVSTVAPGPTQRFVLVNNGGDTMQAGLFGKTTTISAYDGYGNLNTNDNDEVVVTANGLRFDGVADDSYSINLLNGTYTFGVYTTVAASYTVAANRDDLILATGAPLLVVPAGASSITLVPPANIIAGQQGTLLGTVTDTHGNPVTNQTGIQVTVSNFASSPGPLVFSGGALAANIDTTDENGEVAFAYSGEFAAAGYLIQVFMGTDPPRAELVGPFTITSSDIAYFTHTPSLANPISAQTWRDTVRAYDIFGNLAGSAQGQLITLLSTAPDQVITANPVALNATAEAVFELRNDRSGTYAFTARNSRGVQSTSAPVTVLPAAPANVRLRTESNGNGVIYASDSTITTDEVFTIYTAIYDAQGNYIGTGIGDWQGTGDFSSFRRNNRSRLDFNPGISGTGTLIVGVPGLPVAETANLTFTSIGATVASIRIQTRPGDATAFADTTIRAGDTKTFFMGAYDITGGYIGSYSETVWQVTPKAISQVDIGLGENFTFAGDSAGAGKITASLTIDIPDLGFRTFTASTGLITVIPNSDAISYLRLRNAANGLGQDVSGTNITTSTDQSQTYYAAAYDQRNNFVTDYPVTWLLSPELQATASAPPNAAFFIYAPDTVSLGQGQISTSNGDGISDAALNIEVFPGTLARVEIRSASLGAGSPVTTDTLIAGNSRDYWLSGYDGKNAYVSDIMGDWASVPAGLGTFGLNQADSINTASATYNYRRRGSTTLRAKQHGGSRSYQTGPLTILAGPPASLLAVNGDGQSAVAASVLPVPLTVEVRDGNSNRVPDIEVTFAALSGGNFAGSPTLKANSDEFGRVSVLYTLPPALGPDSVNIFVAGVDTVRYSFTAVAGSGNRNLLVIGGDGQSNIVGQRLANPFTIRVEDDLGLPIAGIPISYIISLRPAGDVVGSLTKTSGLTDNAGRDSVFLDLGSIAGEYTISASAAGNSVQFMATAVPDVFSRIEKIAPFSTVIDTVGKQAEPVIVVRLTDSRGNPLAGESADFSIKSGEGSVSAVANSDADGLQEIYWTFGPSAGLMDTLLVFVPGGSDTVKFAGSGLADEIDVLAFVSIRGSPVNGASVVAFSNNEIVGRAYDQYMNPVAGRPITFSVIDGPETIPVPTSNTESDGLFRKSVTFSDVDSTLILAEANGRALQFNVHRLRLGAGMWNPAEVAPGLDTTLTLPLRNTGSIAATISAASRLSFSDGTSTWSATLAGDQVALPRAVTPIVTNSAVVDPDFTTGGYNPVFVLEGPEDLAGTLQANGNPVSVVSLQFAEGLAIAPATGLLKRGENSFPISVNVFNAAPEEVVLDTQNVFLTFDNPVPFRFEDPATVQDTIQGNTSSSIRFIVTIPPTFAPGVLQVGAHIEGVYGGSLRATRDALLGTATYEIENNAELAAVHGSPVPTLISNQFANGLRLAVRNDGSSDVVMEADSTFFVFFPGDTLRLDPTTVGLPGNKTTTLNFVEALTNAPAGVYNGALFIRGTENGIEFIDTLYFDQPGDAINVQNRPLLGLDGFPTLPGDVSQQQSEIVKLRFTNSDANAADLRINSSADIRIDGFGALPVISGYSDATFPIFLTAGSRDSINVILFWDDATSPAPTRFAFDVDYTVPIAAGATLSSTSDSLEFNLRERAKIQIDTILFSQGVVSQGQSGVSMRLALVNEGGVGGLIDSLQLSFANAHTITRRDDFATIVAGARDTIDYEIDIAPASSLGLDSVRVAATYRDLLSQIVHNAPGKTFDAFTIETPASPVNILISRVTPAATQMTAGQSGVALTMRIRNNGQAGFRLVNATPRFNDGQMLLTDNNAYPILIAGAAFVDLNFTVTANLPIASGAKNDRRSRN